MKLALLIATLLTLSSATAEDFTWNVRTAPLTLVVGANLRVDYRVSDHFTVGATGLYIDRQIKAVYIRESAGGLMLQYNLDAALETGWFVQGGFAYGDVHAGAATSTGGVEIRRLQNLSMRLQGGYQWFWDNINVAIGGGLEHNSAGDQDVTDAAGNKINRIPIRKNLFVPEASIGWAF